MFLLTNDLKQSELGILCAKSFSILRQLNMQFYHSSPENGQKRTRRDRSRRKILSTSQKETESAINEYFPAADNYQNPVVLHLKILKVNLKAGDY